LTITPLLDSLPLVASRAIGVPTASPPARFNIIYQVTDNDFESAVELTTNKQLRAYILSYLGLVTYNLGMYFRTSQYQNRSLSIHEELDDRAGMGKDYANIALVLDNMGKYQEALDNHNKALKIHEELNDRVGMAGDYWGRGVVLDNMGKYQEALDNHNKALKIHEELYDMIELKWQKTTTILVLYSLISVTTRRH